MVYVAFFIFVFVAWLVTTTMEDNRSIDLARANRHINENYGKCKFSLISNNGSEYLLITEKDKIVLGQNKLKSTIYIKDIMKVDIKYNVVEQHKQRVLTVMPTFDTTTSLSSVELNIYSFDSIDLNHRFYPSNYNTNMVNQLEKFKYLVENIRSKTIQG